MQPKAMQDALERAARANWRVFRLAELENLGLTRQRIRTMVDRGQLQRRHRAVYSYGHPDLSWQGEFLAAQYAAGDGAYLTRNSGLALAHLWRPYLGEIHLTAARSGRRGNLVIHRTTVPPQPDEIRHDGPLRYAALPRLFIEFAPVSSLTQMTELITKAVRQDKLDHALMQTVLARHAGRPGVARVAAAYAGYVREPPAKSELERRFDRERRQRPQIPEPRTNVRIPAGGITWELDRYWPEHHVGVEVDSRTYHQALRDRAKDERKRAKLLTVGIQTLSISDWRIDYDISDALDDLEAIIARRRPEARPGTSRARLASPPRSEEGAQPGG